MALHDFPISWNIPLIAFKGLTVLRLSKSSETIGTHQHTLCSRYFKSTFRRIKCITWFISKIVGYVLLHRWDDPPTLPPTLYYLSLTRISKNLLMLTVQYFKGSESVGERSTVIVTGFAYLLVAMVSVRFSHSSVYQT